MKSVVSVACLAMALASGAALAEAQPAESPTSVRVFLPFSPAGLRGGLTVVGRVSGECFAPSIASAGRPDAWRCSSGNRVMDPCFEGLQSVVLACATSPWSADVVLLTPTAELPRGKANRPELDMAPPWALELDSGVRCQLLTGATWGAAGMRVNYGCEGDSGYVIGDVDRSRARWQVFFDAPKGVSARTVGVTAAWY